MLLPKGQSFASAFLLSTSQIAKEKQQGSDYPVQYLLIVFRLIDYLPRLEDSPLEAFVVP